MSERFSENKWEDEDDKVGFGYLDYSQIHFDFDYFLKSLESFHKFRHLYGVNVDVAELESIESTLLGEKIKADVLLLAGDKARVDGGGSLVEITRDEAMTLLKNVNLSIETLQRLPNNTEEKFKGVAEQAVREAVVYLNDAKKIIEGGLFPGGKN